MGAQKNRKSKKTNKRFRKNNRKTRTKKQRGGNQKEKDTYLFDAIDIYDYDKVENALNNGANVNARNKDGDTPLIRAIKLEDIDMVYLLLERPDINIELEFATNKELQLAEDLWENMTPEDQEENGIPYAIEDYIITKKEKKRIQNIVAQTIPKHLERQKDRKELAARLSKKGVGSFGDGRMPYELRHEIGKYLGGGKRKTRKSKKSKRKAKSKKSSKRVTRKTRRK
jgi:ankyrin repeat protein